MHLYFGFGLSKKGCGTVISAKVSIIAQILTWASTDLELGTNTRPRTTPDLCTQIEAPGSVCFMESV